MKLSRAQRTALKHLEKALLEAQLHFIDIDCEVLFDEKGNGAAFTGDKLEEFEYQYTPQ